MILILMYREEDSERQTGLQSCQVREKIQIFLSTLPLFQILSVILHSTHLIVLPLQKFNIQKSFFGLFMQDCIY